MRGEWPYSHHGRHPEQGELHNLAHFRENFLKRHLIGVKTGARKANAPRLRPRKRR